ncbi:hypothetical protein NEF87_000377 [Candidatus Lokiarchaeum ossiferum]|uniref:Uncharacterized protein n=1 Tax=Candidatus Lokiarchaeum ossiferum TaxID=2951803 RepID=A0ABY6HNW9_9ARCH|nr:hypothetical protein NEF87_000377 [Candidatus Lokiarchaeum sp. B-35]
MLDLSTNHIISIVISFLVVGIGYVISLFIFMKYVNKRKNIVLYLFMTAFFLITAALIDPIVLLVSRNQLTLELADIMINKGASISFSLTAVANIFLLLFQKDVFYLNRKSTLIGVLIVIEIFIAIITPILGLMSIDIFILLVIHLLTSFIIYGNQAQKANQVSKKSVSREDVVGKKGLSYLKFSGIVLSFVLVSFIFQEIIRMFKDFFIPIGLIDELGCSLFVPLAWLLSLIGLYCMYIGYLMPEWIKKRWEKK